MCTRLERHVQRRTLGPPTGIAERDHLGVRATRRPRPSLADDAPAPDDDGPDGRIRARATERALCEGDCPRHPTTIAGQLSALWASDLARRHGAPSAALR